MMEGLEELGEEIAAALPGAMAGFPLPSAN